MFSSDSEDDTFERMAPKKRAAPPKLGKRRRGGNETTDDEDLDVVEESANSLLTPNMSAITPNVSISGGNTSHPAFNGSEAAAHSTPDLQNHRDELKEAKQKKRSFVADTYAHVSSVINDDQEEAWQLAQESRTSAAPTSDSLHLLQKQQPYQIAGACFDIKLSSEQLSEHLANCIQLNAANKINKGNAFNLQLIDYMFVLLRRNDKTMQDFPTMSCSLDASTRIYACRVDSVHAGIMEIVSGLSRAGDKNKKKMSKADGGSGGEENSDEEGGNEQQRARARKRKAVIASSLDALCRTKIETASWMQRPAIQPDFTSLLRQASVTLAENCCLSLLQDDIKLIPPRRSKQPATTERNKQIVSVPIDLTASTYDYDFGFSWSDGEDGDASSDVMNDYDDNDFSFNVHNNTVISAVSHRNSNFSSGVEDDVFVSPIDVEEEVEAVKEAPPKNKESLVSVVSGDDCDNEVLMNESIGGDDSCDEVVAEIKEPNKKRHDTLSLVSSKALLAEGDSCYSYIDSELLPDVWVGPEFWKPKFKRGKPAACQQAPEKVVEKKTRRKNKRTDLLSFEDFTNVDEIFDKKSGTAAQTRMIGKMSEKKLTLPGKKNCKMQDVYRSFLRKNLFYKPFLKPDKDSTEARVEYEYADDGEHLFNNENNRIGDIDGEGVGGIVINNDNNQSDCDDFNDDYAEEPVEHVDDDEDDNVEEAGSNEVFSAENLVPMPKLVQCDAIKYATVPKRLDMKKLKTTIWSMLDLEDDKENRRSSKIEKNEHRTFSNIYRHLPEQIVGEMRKDMSPALAFLAILHLANEKTLSIKPADSTLTDLEIRKTFFDNS